MSQPTETTDAGDPVSKNADSSSSQEAQKDMNQNDERKRKALAILQHRKMLLGRLQLCKKATQTRLKEYEKPSSAKKGMDTETNKLTASRKRTFTSKEEEIKTYNELSESAMNFTVKKAPIKPPPAPTPRNISLRTGSSVGNKMKAAVATLTTNVGWISDASSSSSQVQRNTSISPIAPGSINPVQSSITSSSQNEGASLKADNKPIEQKMQMNGKSATKSISNGAQLPLSQSSDVFPIKPNINVKKVDVSVGKQAKKRLSHSGKKINKKSSKSSSSSNEPLPVTSKPIHQMVQKSIPTLMIDETRSSRPPIICPEADRLRKKRRLLVQKLDSLIKNTYADAMIIKQSSEGRSLKRLHYDDNPYSSANKIAWQSFMKADEPPCMLPERRKTQWDYVLEEMRWLSTDFIEEKKWKLSTAKVVATSVLKHRAEKFNQIKSSPKKSIKSSSIEKKEISQIKEVTIETKSSKEDESMDEESDTESVTEERISTLEFVDPTDDDLENVKNISSKIDKMIIDTWIIRRNEDSYQNNDVASTSKTGKNTMEYNSDENECTMKQLTFIEMKDEVEKIRDYSNQLHTQDDMNEKIIECIQDAQVEVYDDQLQVLHHTMSLWQASKGSILSGPIGCGKTFMTSLLAWTRRNEGVQIVTCPSISVFRWRRELNGFPDLNVVVVKSEETLHSCLDSQDLSQLVIVCDFTTFGEFCKSDRSTNFASVFVDLRCTSFPSSSLTSDTISNRGQKQRIIDHGKTTIDKIHGKEISSTEWWDRLIASAVSVETRCILVETNSVFEGLDFSHKPQNVDKDQQIPGILSSKIAFLLKQTFYSKNQTFSRRAFWWARKYFISNTDDTNILKRAEKIEGAQSILRQFLKDIMYKPDVVKEETGESLASCVPKWTIQLCPMTEIQRINYEQECFFARGAFQNDALNQGTSFIASKALLRLRRLCFGSDFTEILNGSHSRARIKNIGREIASSSQPNVEKAKSLLDSSSKLRQLLTILCKDCGFDVPVKNYLLGSKTTRRGRKSSASKRKKVLILASLPEVLLLLSSFLNALGITHKLLAPPVLSKQQSQEEDSCQRLWMENQFFLDLYNHDSDDQSQKNTAFSLNVLVSSPKMLASTSFGMGASNADVIVSVDEDWSGSSDLSVFSILRKNVTRNSQKVTGRKFIKIVSEDSCEQTFLTHEKSRGKKALLALPFLSSTLLNTSFNFENGEVQCDFPEVGWKIFRHVGLSLDSIFCVEALDQNIYGQRLIFLASPTETNDDFQLSSLPQSWEKAAVLDEVSDDEEENDKNSEKYKFLREAILNVEQNVPISSIAASSVESTGSKDPYLHYSCNNSIECTFQNDALHTVSLYIGSRRNTIDKDESKANEDLNHGITPEATPGTSGVKKEKVKVQKEMEVSSAKSFSDCISEKMPSSLLWYKSSSMSSNRRVDGEASDSVAPQRVNGHVRSYMSSKKTFDGNQGCESLVYFPPIIPGVVGSSKSLETDISSIDRDLENASESKKRKQSVPPSQGSSKKMRGSNPTTAEPLDFSPNLNNNGVGQPLPNIPGDFLNDVDFMDDSNDLFGGEDFFSDLGNITKEDEISSPPKPCEEEQETIETIDAVDVIKPSLDEDFGILGPGIMPPLEESSMVAMKEVIHGNSHSYWLDPSEPKLCDDFLSSGGLSLDSAIIHVTKSNAKTGNEGSGSQIGPLVHGSSMNSASIFNKTPSMTAFIAPTMSTSVNQSILPYSAHHGIYPILIHHRLQDAFDPSANHIGNGVLSSKNQNSLVSQFSIRELDKDEHTGDTAKCLAEEQLSIFFSKSSLSNGADFGPFSANVLPNFSVWDDSISQETKSGIQLPMGVKLPKSVGMVNAKGEEWSTEEDTTLKHFVVELQKNWHAISQAITHKSRNSVCQDCSMSPNPIRSARACKERWDVIKASDTVENKSFVESRKPDKTKHDFPVLLDANKATNFALSSDASAKNSTRFALRFKRLKNSREKINLVPLTIPGHAGAIVSSHSSHSQSVQDAISQSARPSGIVPPRAEMWPLQFLDLTEKQKRQVEAQKKGSQIVGGAGMQPTAVPPHNMPGRHPTNQPMPVATNIPSRRPPPQQHPVPHTQNQQGNYTAPVGAVPPPRQTQPQQSTSPQGTSNNR